MPTLKSVIAWLHSVIINQLLRGTNVMTELEAISPHSTELTLKLSIAPSDVGHTLGLSQTTLFCFVYTT